MIFLVGAIACTHVAIIAPKKEDPLYQEELHVIRKRYYPIIEQLALYCRIYVIHFFIKNLIFLICVVNIKILNVCAQYPGSTKDAFIWSNSPVNDLLQNLRKNGHISLLLLGEFIVIA